jgi:hypothetical protein
MTADRQVELLRWLKESGPDHDRQVQHAIRQGGAEADFIMRHLSKPQRQRGDAPANKASQSPQTK